MGATMTATKKAYDKVRAERKLARRIEREAKTLSDLFESGAVTIMRTALCLKMAGDRQHSRVFGQWAALFSSLGSRTV
jgi:hypothetical protein